MSSGKITCSAVGKRERVREEGDKRERGDQIKMRGGGSGRRVNSRGIVRRRSSQLEASS